MLTLYNLATAKMCKVFTLEYTTSFGIGISLLDKSIQQAIFDIYGFVRLADEIVDTFDAYNQKALLEEMKRDTFKVIKEGISTNPIFHRFQLVVNEYDIDLAHIESFFASMEMDLSVEVHENKSYNEYVYGSAAVVGLMCITVFIKGSGLNYEVYKEKAQLFGSVLQKINFLRDISYDYNQLQRSYFPNVDLKNFNEEQKQKIQQEIYGEFLETKRIIFELPSNSKYGVYIVYKYYFELYKKIKRTPASKIMNVRIRVSNGRKLFIFICVYIRKLLRV